MRRSTMSDAPTTRVYELTDQLLVPATLNKNKLILITGASLGGSGTNSGPDIRRNGSAGSCRCFASGWPWAWRCVRTRPFPFSWSSVISG